MEGNVGQEEPEENVEEAPEGDMAWQRRRQVLVEDAERVQLLALKALLQIKGPSELLAFLTL